MAIDDDSINPIIRDEEWPKFQNPTTETSGIDKATTTPIPPIGGFEVRSTIAKTLSMATADEGSRPEAGNPQNQEQEVHDNTRLA